MTTSFDQILACVTQLPTTVAGLKWQPSLEPHVDNNQDWPPFGFPNSPEVSDCNLMLLKNAVDKLGAKLRTVVEIGVDRNGNRSFTSLLLRERPPGSTYVGIDIEQKSHIHQPEANQYFLQSSSEDQQRVRGYLAELGVDSIDLLMIDGWHSVNTAVNDWSYCDLISPHGMILLHDTNSHPGPVCLFDAVDETQWRKWRYCTSNDMGIALFSRV
jgi:hypothetical protein